MLNFKMDALRNWRQITTGEMYEFPVPGSGYRKVSFDLMASEPVSVQAVTEEGSYLVAHGEGLMSVSFTTDKSVALVALGHPDVLVYLRTFDDTQVIPESLDPSFTAIEPRPAGPSQEVRQLMHIMKLNERRREQQYAAQLEELRRQRDPGPQVIEDEPKPAKPADKPAKPADKPAEGGSDDAG